MENDRNRKIAELLLDESAFRTRQAIEAIYSPFFRSWDGVSSLPKPLRSRIASEIPWITLSPIVTMPSVSGDAWKSLLGTRDGHRIESVLLRNARGHFTVCVSTQVGCAMGCAFCATGQAGFVRNLSRDEIVDQVRFFRDFVSDEKLSGEITNLVLMGMGEPLANYEEVREALRAFIDRLGIGTTRITVSTVGLLDGLERLLSDPEWPPVRIAISLHTADGEVRKRLMPSTVPGFFDRLVAWSREYGDAFPEKRRHLTLEYLLLSGVNDSDGDLRELIRFVHRMSRVRVNLIPYNATDAGFSGSGPRTAVRFRDALEAAGITVTVRKSQGGDIAAACGQLAGKRG
jgi:23S rRNA (adenine2503-C2)-methyltransferase